MSMRISNMFLVKTVFALGFVFISHSAFSAEVIIRKDDSVKTIPTQFKSLLSIIPVTASENGIELTINFVTAINDVNVQIINEEGQIVYQSNLNTSLQSSIIIPYDTWESGLYTIHINYGSTSLIGEFYVFNDI